MKMTISFCVKQNCQVNGVEQGMVSMSPNKETSPAQCYHKVKWAHCELMTFLRYLMY